MQAKCFCADDGCEAESPALVPSSCCATAAAAAAVVDDPQPGARGGDPAAAL